MELLRRRYFRVPRLALECALHCSCLNVLGAASKNGGDNMDEGMSRQRHGGTLAGEPPSTVSRLKCLGSCMKRRVFIRFTSVS